MTERKCFKCFQMKPLDDFSRGKGAHGRVSQCRICCHEYFKRVQAKEREQLIEAGVITVLEKECRLCGLVKGQIDFARHSKSTDGLTPSCMECMKGMKHREPMPKPNLSEIAHVNAMKRPAPQPKGVSQGMRRALEADAVRQERWADHLRKRWKISVEQYENMLSVQGGVCAICGGGPNLDKPFVIDHDHDTGKIRGLLCAGCNLGLGHLKDDITRVEGALLYLQRYLPEQSA